MDKPRILIASPVRQKANILKEFLFGLKNLVKEKFIVDFTFVDDNTDPLSKEMLRKFTVDNSLTTIFSEGAEDTYVCNEKTHHWNLHLISKVAAFKDKFIRHALEGNYDYLFLVDSDLILQPQTLEHLFSLEKDIVSEVFWTKWFDDQPPLPQVWMSDEYNFFAVDDNQENISANGVSKSLEFLDMLKKPGTYKVGGLGACTLISRKALLKGVSFQKIYNLSFVGEDRHFCIRAAALGLDLYADTHYPPFHVYRESDLQEAREYKKTVFKCHTPRMENRINNYVPRLTLAMVVRNEAGRYLKEVLQNCSTFIDDAVIIDDCSDDESVDICKKVLADIPLKLLINKEVMFQNEITLRKKLWNVVVENSPDWILFLDADEIFEDRAKQELRKLLYEKNIDAYMFRLFDFWNKDCYREDQYWQAHRYYRHFLIRYKSDFPYQWLEQPLHCGRMPANVHELKSKASELRIKHFGWAKPKDRVAKFFRYRKLDPQARYGIAAQYESILDPNPCLIKWNESQK